MSLEPVVRSVRLSRSAARAWEEAASLEGVNGELMPLARMTVPRRLRGRRIDPAEVPIGEPLGRSWILLFGILPIDYDELRIVEIDPPRRFLERSRTLAFSTWEHERRIEPDGDGCVVTDRLGFELRPGLRRVPGARALARGIVGALFAHRHRRLASRDTPRP